MSDGGEKTCPLCAEEMDLTDQQLKPCKCGYEICVWCWHHIMDMAEKDATDGRCPACRSIYDKEKIVGMASSCERLVAEISVEKKVKSQKAKAKSSEGRKQLSSVRVVQRNLVYIVGLPLNLADEDLLQRREYFGQYGKVLKVSMSRTATGVIQQFPNNTCSVYITYSKEEEAVRCIQNVHQFVLECKPLRACFGTTKYCHAWLRNAPCTNPDCLYLHEVGSQEDSFTKDEIISAYTRSRVQQITGASNNMQQRSGSVLPPPMDDYCNNNTSNGKPIVKNTSSNTSSMVRGSPPNESSDKPIALPAAASWGTRGSNFQAPATRLPSPNGPPIRSDAANSILSFPPAVAGISLAPTVHSEAVKRPTFNESHTANNAKGHQESFKSSKAHVSMDCRSFSTDRHDSPEEVPTSVSLSCPGADISVAKDSQKGMAMAPNISTCTLHIEDSCSCLEAGDTSSVGLIQSLNSDMSTVSIDRDNIDDQSGLRPNALVSNHDLIKASRDHHSLQEQFSGQSIAHLTSTDAWKGNDVVNCMSFSREEQDWRSDVQREVVNATEMEEDVISFNSQRLQDPEIVSPSTRLPGWPSTFHAMNGSTSHSLWPDAANGVAATSLATDLPFVDKPFIDNSSLSSSIPLAFRSQFENGVNTSGQSLHTLRHMVGHDPANLSADSLFVDKQFNSNSHFRASNISTATNINKEHVISSSSATDTPHANSFLLNNEGRGRHMGRLSGDTSNTNSNSFVDNGENSIISNILSMDYNMWDNGLTSQNFSKLLGETDKQTPSSRKVQNNNQSRFSFARQEDSKGHDFRIQPSLDITGQIQRNQSLRRDFSENGNVHLDKFHNSGGFYSNSYDGPVNHSNNHSLNSSNKLSVSRAQISAPPGFSVPSRVPPPGFSSHDRVDQVSDSFSGNHLFEASSILRNSHHANQNGNNVSTGDLEFMDPAILAVGKGRRQIGLNNTGLDTRNPFSPSSGTFDNEASLQLLMQRSLNPQQRYSDVGVGDGFSHLGDSYGISSRLVDQSQVNNLSNFAQLSLQHSRNGLMSHGHWDGWNEVQGGTNIGVADILRNDRLGYNKYYAGYEDSKFRMPSSSDLYNRTFGM